MEVNSNFPQGLYILVLGGEFFYSLNEELFPIFIPFGIDFVFALVDVEGKKGIPWRTDRCFH